LNFVNNYVIPMPRKLVITDGSSLLGNALLKVFKTSDDWDTFSLTTTTSTNENFIKCDFGDKDAVKNLLQRLKPDVVIHCPSIQPAEAESDPKTAEFWNTTCTDILAQVCSKIGSWLLFISSDNVFDGTKPPYSSNSETNPVNVLGRTCREGEMVLWKNQTDGGVLRIPLLYGRVTKFEDSLVSQLTKVVLDGSSVTLDNSQNIYPTFAEDVAVVCRGLAERKLEHCGLYGTWHWSGSERFTRYTLALELATIIGKSHENILASQTPNNSTPLPHDAQLNCIALSVMGLGRQTHFRDGIAAMLSILVPQK